MEPTRRVASAALATSGVAVGGVAPLGSGSDESDDANPCGHPGGQTSDGRGSRR